RHAALLVRTLDHDLRDAGLLQLVHQVGADLQVLMEELAVFGVVGEPAALPGAVDTEAEANRINLLTHQAASPFSSTSRTTIVRCENGFSMRDARPRPRAWNRFMVIDLPT